MQPIQWNDYFEIGIEEIDVQHRTLVEMFSKLEHQKDCADAATIGGLLHQLADYARDHFSLEERLMSLGKFDTAFVARHRGEHSYIRGILKDLLADHDAGRLTVNSALIEYLSHWLFHHIVVTDRDMAQQHSEMEPALAAKILAQAKSVTNDLEESQRQLIVELLHANAELTRQLNELRSTRPAD